MPRNQTVDAAISALMETDLISVVLSLLSDDVRAGDFELLGKCAAVCVGWRDAARLEARARLEGWAARARTMPLDIPSFAPLVCSMTGAMALTQHRHGTFQPADDWGGGDATDRSIALCDTEYRGSMVAKLAWRFSNVVCRAYCFPPEEEPSGPDRIRSYDADSDGDDGDGSDGDDGDDGEEHVHATLFKIFWTFVVRFDQDHLKEAFGLRSLRSFAAHAFDADVCAALELLLGGIRYSKHESSNLLWIEQCAQEYTPASQAKVLASLLQGVWLQHIGAARYEEASAIRARLRAAQPHGPLRIPPVKMCHLRQALSNYMRARDSELARKLWQTSRIEPQIQALGPELAPLVRQYFAIDKQQSGTEVRLNMYEARFHLGKKRARNVHKAYEAAKDAWFKQEGNNDSEAEAE